ncbi:MAG: coiled-coil domain-containing protein [bacterium]|jgi:peptidoglycan hydrolase CwlO-like protein
MFGLAPVKAPPSKAILSILIVVLFLFPLVLQAAPVDQPSLPTAAEQEQLQEQLMAEILSLDTHLAALKREEARARQRLEELQQELNLNQQEKENLIRAVQAAQANVTLWLRFLAEDGALTYLDVLLGAVDLTDFLQRLDLVAVLIESNINRLEQRKELLATVSAQEQMLTVQQNEISTIYKAIAESVAAAEKLRQSRARALAEAERTLADFDSVAALSQAWEAILPDLDHLIGQLPNLPWESLQPDSLEVNYFLRTAFLTYNQPSLAALLNTGLPANQQSEIQFSAGKLVLNRPSVDGRPPYSITLSLTPQERTLIFEPISVTVADTTISAATLAPLMADYDLSLELPLLPGSKIKNVQLEDGRLLLMLSA